MSAVAGARRVRARVDGTVQGVGFRPYVHRLTRELGLGGFVRNDEHGVLLEVEGAPEAVAAFLERLPRDAPPLARIERVEPVDVRPLGSREFAIEASAVAGSARAQVAPDVATCPDCLRELRDPADRRYRYPFVNCTNCGPRFTIVRGVPYDRARTTMAGFAMCDACRAEYEDPGDRRFHAQPNACPVCGPRLRLAGGGSGSGDPLTVVAEALRAGAIVAVKGLGGFHLACRADDERAVATLRSRKHREDKPFALMAADVGAAAELAELREQATALLCGPQRPIVLAPRRADAAVAAAVAPGARELGVMLPYSPLHHLLLEDAGTTLVMTSGNVSDEPIAYEDEDALARLASIADLFLLHDRPIHTRTDDSVLRVVRGGRPQVLRRSRGHVPAALDLGVDAPVPVLACGAELKSTFCLARGRRAWVGHHVGDLRNEATWRSFTEGVAHFERLFAVTPRVVAHDLHPDYLSTRYALERSELAPIGVQHHHAHLAACLAEHGVAGPAVGAIFDGVGWGLDGTAWGGELLAGDLCDFERVGHLRAAPLPGGDRAAREPWRMACAWLVAAGELEPPVPGALAGRVDPARWRAVASMARSGAAAAPTTSVGRLFDAVAALCGLRLENRYEGQAAIELEAAAWRDERGSYELPVAGAELDARALVRAVRDDVAAGAPVGAVAARFHRGLARATAHWCAGAAAARGCETVVLSGGVFQNVLLLEATAARLEGLGLRVLTPEALPPNDGGIAYGQAAVAAARLERGIVG
ncbi:MAG TPA: carbamoyltransferase HypF [Solirubrobacteraceae bacterium]|nr:carbamoyltransferase HypF [Solirubrobacteraceae bacterium]